MMADSDCDATVWPYWQLPGGWSRVVSRVRSPQGRHLLHWNNPFAKPTRRLPRWSPEARPPANRGGHRHPHRGADGRTPDSRATNKHPTAPQA
jgi:hypothetical protein